MTITLKQMRYAVALAETGHFGRAAERCRVTQPALSQQIQLIEEICGAPLFDRLGKAVRPTPFGGELVERARKVLESADDLMAFAQGHAGQPSAPIRFGLIPTVAPYLLPDIFPALQTQFPSLAFRVSESRTETLLKGLAEGDLDLALIATDPPPGGPRLTVSRLFPDSFVLATSRVEAPEEPVQLASLPAERILLLDEGHCFRDQAIAACSIAADPSARAFAATSLSTIVEFVANGQGITLLPEIAVRKEATDPRIVIRSLAAPGAGRDLSLVWRETTPFAALFEEIAEIIRQSHADRAILAA
ncbi:hydrogen peroxide-inducible genes activator [Paradevosia shaoguanensis]|uniref:hydrogen peroxide-inducible genes activator n=1 Tax=Paradevosia shaoguanensis TaxID=1335043 RepID=UPI003C7746B0